MAHGMVNKFSHTGFVCIDDILELKLSVEIVCHCQIKDDLADFLTLALADLCQASAAVLLVDVTVDLANRQEWQGTAHSHGGLHLGHQGTSLFGV